MIKKANSKYKIHLKIKRIKMIFNVNKIKKDNFKFYEKTSIDIARSFTSVIYKEIGDLIKIVVLFGSSARQNSSIPNNDIDILIVVDDTTIEWTEEVVEAYRLIIEKAITTTAPDKLHITTLKLTSFWEYLRNGDPIAINILRDGVSLIDHNIFDAIQTLLYEGRIRPSLESIYTYYGRAPKTLSNSRWHLLEAIKDLYWAVIDSSHAALMTKKEIPPSPEFVNNMINDVLISKGLIDKKYSNVPKIFYELVKKIERREISFISGKEFDDYYKKAQDYVIAIDQFISKELNSKK